MEQNALALVPYDPRLQRPFHAMQMDHDIMLCEWGLNVAQNPREVQDVMKDLELMLGLMMWLKDMCHYPQIAELLNRARVKSFQQCYARLQRCAELVDASNTHTYCAAALPPPSYDAIALAITDADDVLPFVASLTQQYYIEDLRPSLVSFMEHYNYSDDASVGVPIPRPARSKRRRPPKKNGGTKDCKETPGYITGCAYGASAVTDTDIEALRDRPSISLGYAIHHSLSSSDLCGHIGA